MTAAYGFTIADAIEVGDAVESLWDLSVNSLLDHAHEFADGVGAYLDDRQRLPREVREKVVTAADRENAARYAFVDVFRSNVAQATTFTLDELCEAQPSLERDRGRAPQCRPLIHRVQKAEEGRRDHDRDSRPETLFENPEEDSAKDDFFADRATPRTLPSARVNSETSKSASRSG